VGSFLSESTFSAFAFQILSITSRLQAGMPIDKYGGLLSRFSCVQSIDASSPTLETDGSSSDSLKSMRGELEVVVIPEDSHRLFPGQRTVIRFRLVG
jgi:hypothetical protein